MNYKEQMLKGVQESSEVQVPQAMVPPLQNTSLVSYQVIFGPQVYNLMPWMWFSIKKYGNKISWL